MTPTTAFLIVASWVAAMAAAVLGPVAVDSATLGDDLTRYTVRVALLYYLVAALGMVRRPNPPGPPSLRGKGGVQTVTVADDSLTSPSGSPPFPLREGGPGGLGLSPARLCWTLGWAAFLVHLACAMHFYHHWSHADAYRHTEEVSGVGWGIFVSHLFTLLWTADVAWWWLSPASHAIRPAWITRGLHGFMAFIIFNGTVVYEEGPIRYFGLAMFAVLGTALVWRRRQARPGWT